MILYCTHIISILNKILLPWIWFAILFCPSSIWYWRWNSLIAFVTFNLCFRRRMKCKFSTFLSFNNIYLLIQLLRSDGCLRMRMNHLRVKNKKIVSKWWLSKFNLSFFIFFLKTFLICDLLSICDTKQKRSTY